MSAALGWGLRVVAGPVQRRTPPTVQIAARAPSQSYLPLCCQALPPSRPPCRLGNVTRPSADLGLFRLKFGPILRPIKEVMEEVMRDAWSFDLLDRSQIIHVRPFGLGMMCTLRAVAAASSLPEMQESWGAAFKIKAQLLGFAHEPPLTPCVIAAAGPAL